jgi:hypothetical protein
MTPVPQWPRTVTTALIITITVILIVWDFIAYYLAATQATESDVAGNWLCNYLWITLAASLLFGHLLGSGKTPITATHIAIVIVGMLLGYFATVLS